MRIFLQRDLYFYQLFVKLYSDTDAAIVVSKVNQNT